MNIEKKLDVFQRQLSWGGIIILLIFVTGVIIAGGNPGSNGEVIDRANQITLTKKPDNIVSSGFWTPTNQETTEALHAIDKYLTKLSKTRKEDMPRTTTQNSAALTNYQISKIRKSLWKYRVQFIGINFDSRKVIYCNFFLYDPKKYAKWKKEYVDISEGGTAFWQIDYDINSKQCTDLTINSEDIKKADK